MAISLSDLFTKAGKAWHACNTTNTATGTTVEDEVEDYTQQFTTEAIDIKATVEGLNSRLKSFQSSGGSLVSSIVTSVKALFVEMTKADVNLVSYSELNVQEEVISQMEVGDTIDASAIACTPTYAGANTGDGVVVISTKRPDGKVNEHTYQETQTFKATSTSGNTANFLVTGEETVSNKLSHLWPGGSGIRTTVTSTSAADSNLLTNGTLELEDDNDSNLPQSWQNPVGTLGTTLKLSSIETQTITITGTPTSGHYYINWVDSDSQAQTTVALAFNASNSDVESALSSLNELDEVTVATAGVTPNFTHTITFTGVTNPASVTVTDNTDSGSFAIAVPTAGSANVVRGARSVEWDSNGSELTSLVQPITLQAGTQYAFHMLMKVDSAPAAGVMTVDIADGYNGTTINDDEGTANSFTVDPTGLTTSWSSETGVFRTPTNLPSVVYLRIRITTAISNTSSVFMDEVSLKEMTRLYVGGGYAAMFAGATPWKIDDEGTMPWTNDRAGAIHEWLNRTFNLAENDLLYPTDSGGTETISDSLIG